MPARCFSEGQTRPPPGRAHRRFPPALKSDLCGTKEMPGKAPADPQALHLAAGGSPFFAPSPAVRNRTPRTASALRVLISPPRRSPGGSSCFRAPSAYPAPESPPCAASDFFRSRSAHFADPRRPPQRCGAPDAESSARRCS